ncbi:hypothetical protein WR25_15884 [Diploscapter pachys]|uniref:Carboxypeptidase n=1 Tax=Diploscapter pachys TaxID=2018661 RepID=A0A2A2LHB8_9BILA|nr:hypothetical protein WR25_15884 [Diploscapter pachys]
MREYPSILLVLIYFVRSEPDVVTDQPKTSNHSDYVPSLPGMLYQHNFNIFSGYLNADKNATLKMFYILTEAKIRPETAPLLVWFNGGPGCSSLTGMFVELGPVYANFFGDTLFENPYSWNFKANVLFLESPIGVGFSYDTNNSSTIYADDDVVAEQNYQSLTDFFSRVHPQYHRRTFFLAGESYAGVYVPTLAAKITQSINERIFPNVNFQGMAIGNGFMNAELSMNKLILWAAYHGRTSADEWDQIKEACRTEGAKDVDSEFSKFMTSKNGIEYIPNNSTCGKLLQPLTNVKPNGELAWTFDFYNYYRTCYHNFSSENATNPIQKALEALQTKNIAALMNTFSDDGKFAYACWAEDSVSTYLNDKETQDALHVSVEARRGNETYEWTTCSDVIFEKYKVKYKNTKELFNYVLQNTRRKDFRILIFSGDIDTACNFMADDYFMREIAKSNNMEKTNAHQPWFTSETQQEAGFYRTYEAINRRKTKISLHVLTVKGSGHFVPLDRPQASLQMISNFMFPLSGKVNFSRNHDIYANPSLSPIFDYETASANLPTTEMEGDDTSGDPQPESETDNSANEEENVEAVTKPIEEYDQPEKTNETKEEEAESTDKPEIQEETNMSEESESITEEKNKEEDIA